MLHIGNTCMNYRLERSSKDENKDMFTYDDVSTCGIMKKLIGVGLLTVLLTGCYHQLPVKGEQVFIDRVHASCQDLGGVYLWIIPSQDNVMCYHKKTVVKPFEVTLEDLERYRSSLESTKNK